MAGEGRAPRVVVQTTKTESNRITATLKLEFDPRDPAAVNKFVQVLATLASKEELASINRQLAAQARRRFGAEVLNG